MNMQGIGQVMRPTLVLFVLAYLFVGNIPAPAQSGGWTKFCDPQTGLSFRYPPNLRIHLRDPQKFGLPNVKTIVDLVGNTKLNPRTIVLRFIVKRGHTSAKQREKKVEVLRRACEKTSPIIVDGHKAVVCISRGRAAVGWSIDILEPRECSIVTLLGGADYEQSLPPPHDGEFPLLSIIRTVHFSEPPGTATH